jgi:hypothetical protein
MIRATVISAIDQALLIEGTLYSLMVQIARLRTKKVRSRATTPNIGNRMENRAVHAISH